MRLGRFRPAQAMPIADHVMDRIMSSDQPRAKKELAAEPDMAEVPELRRRLGAHLSDEEFLLRATMPAGQVDAIQPPGAAPRHYDPRGAPGAWPSCARCCRGRAPRRSASAGPASTWSSHDPAFAASPKG